MVALAISGVMMSGIGLFAVVGYYIKKLLARFIYWNGMENQQR